MIFVHFNPEGLKRITDMQHVFHNQTALLIGGAPSLTTQPLELLTKRGVLTMAMNNAALHFQPSLWCSGDKPDCYDPQILLDPRIIKFAPFIHAHAEILEKKYYEMPNIYFYMQEEDVPWDEYLAERSTVPWYNNTLLVSIHVLYNLGVKRIILGGSDFGFSGNKKDMYAHKTNLGDLERKWNLDLYNSLVRELRMLKPVFEKAGMEFYDCSVNSRIGQVYKKITMEEAVDMCLENFPAKPVDPATLPHCSKFAPESIQQRIAKWPGHQMIGDTPKQSAQAAAQKKESLL